MFGFFTLLLIQPFSDQTIFVERDQWAVYIGNNSSEPIKNELSKVTARWGMRNSLVYSIILFLVFFFTRDREISLLWEL